MQVSIVIPIHNEEGNIIPLLHEIRQALVGHQYEIICVDDYSTDQSQELLCRHRSAWTELRVIRLHRQSGQSAALRVGVHEARFPLVVTLDGDGQNDPADIPNLIKALAVLPGDGRPVMMAGQRAKRQDTWFRRFSSRVANGVRRSLLNDATPDTGCGLKLFPRQSFLDMAHFNHLHRFMPALMIRQGGRVVSVPVNHRPRERGISKYGLWNRLWVGIVDLFGVMWLMKRPVAPKVTEVEGR